MQSGKVMNSSLLQTKSKRGQALPAAVIVLTVLLVLGLVFVGILGRNIRQVGASESRTASQQLAEAGIKYAHSQLINSEKQADWRPAETVLSTAGDITRDPDVLFLRPGSGFGFRSPADTVIDNGGPDGLGPYSRSIYPGGRNLFRVRYAPSDSNIGATVPVGDYNQPGKLRNYLIIESVGREGRIDINDPTTLTDTAGTKYRNYVSDAEYRANLAQMQDRDSRIVSSKKMVAFVSIGIIDHALFITDKDRTSRPAELGADPLNGVSYQGVPVVPTLRLGSTYDAPGNQVVQGGGSIWSNSDLRFYGQVEAVLNPGLGDGIHIARKSIGADPSSTLRIFAKVGDDSSTVGDADIILQNSGATVNGAGAAGSLDSTNPNFRTFSSIIRDDARTTDAEGYPRYIGYKAPPSFIKVDAATGRNPYLTITQSSGRILGSGNSGRHGHGQGVYVGNVADRQIRSDESAREDAGSEESMLYDFLNPNNGLANSGWQGPFYVPVGSFVKFNWDGFTITRDGRAPGNQRTWRRPDGSDSGLSTIRYRIGDPDGAGPLGNFIINSLTNPADIDAPNPVWANGFPFNGMMYFEGNVRVRGVIPTDVQITLISMASIYIEGSITKGVVTDNAGSVLSRPSRSALMLMAKDYVVVNTTQFFGLANGQGLSEKSEAGNPDANNPLVMSAATGQINFLQEFMFRNDNVPNIPAVNAANPSTWRPYTLDYEEPGSQNPIVTQLLLSHSMDDGAGQASFIEMEVNRGLATSTYGFDNGGELAGSTDLHNSVSLLDPPYGPGVWSQFKGLGHRPYQRFPSYENRAFPLIRPVGPGNTTWTGQNLVGNSNEGTWTMRVGGDTNIISLFASNIGFTSTNDYVLRKAAIIPHDIRIEASMYAEDGSFFVIPGRWFNNNPNDRRENYASWGANNAQRDAYRLANFGSTPEMPFYNEAMDVRITVYGAVSQNMTPSISAQSEYMKKWGWIPREQGSSGRLIPSIHVPNGYDIVPGSTRDDRYVPNLNIVYDPVLATGRITGFVNVPNSYVRSERVGTIDYPLPPMPRLPVSPTLAYFGEVNP